MFYALNSLQRLLHKRSAPDTLFYRTGVPRCLQKTSHNTIQKHFWITNRIFWSVMSWNLILLFLWVFCLLLDSGVGRLLPAPGNSDYGRQADCCPQRSGQPVVRSNFRTVVIRIRIWIWCPSCFFLGKTFEFSIINYCK